MNTTRSRESSPASMRLYDSWPVKLYLAFNAAKVECMSETDEEFPASFSREKLERTVNRSCSHICLVLWRMIFPELVRGIARGAIRQITATSTLR